MGRVRGVSGSWKGPEAGSEPGASGTKQPGPHRDLAAEARCALLRSGVDWRRKAVPSSQVTGFETPQQEWSAASGPVSLRFLRANRVLAAGRGAGERGETPGGRVRRGAGSRVGSTVGVGALVPGRRARRHGGRDGWCPRASRVLLPWPRSAYRVLRVGALLCMSVILQSELSHFFFSLQSTRAKLPHTLFESSFKSADDVQCGEAQPVLEAGARLRD